MNNAKQTPPAKRVLPTTTKQKADFKESYYVIGDKLETLVGVAAEMQDAKARKELAELIFKMQTLRSALKTFGDRRLPNWD